jgi:hypothetical protein
MAHHVAGDTISDFGSFTKKNHERYFHVKQTENTQCHTCQKMHLPVMMIILSTPFTTLGSS